jgi:signal transduction histidine kinase
MQENLIESTERQLPVLVGGEQVGMAFVLYKTRGLEQQVQTKLLTTLGQLMSVSVSTFFLAIIAGIWMATGISRPILKLVEAAQAIGSGQLDYQTTLSLRHDELGTLAQEMEAMSKKLKQLDEIKDDFVASVSHDLRAPLAAIYSYADAILKKTYNPTAAKQMKAVEYILTSARSLNLMVDNVLDLAKIKAGSVHLNAKSVNMKELIEREIGLYALLAEKNQIALATNFNAAGPNVYGDAQSISRVLNNLVFNALKFTPSEGRITVATRTEGAQLRVDVHNTGTSISAENLNRLFHRFEPLEKNSSASKGFVGTGLGLSVVKQLVELNGGQVSAHSAEGQGVTFSFTLPVGK